MDEEKGWNLVEYSPAMLSVSAGDGSHCSIFNGDDALGHQLILRNLYVGSLNRLQPLCKFLEGGFCQNMLNLI
jgi:hypothetical protein